MGSKAALTFRAILQESKYPIDAYVFVREALAWSTEYILEKPQRAAKLEMEVGAGIATSGQERHVTGQQLCEGIRRYATVQFGYMARTVFRSWNIYSTSDFGNIVFNMIDMGMMKKSPNDRRSHFDDVYDFGQAFETDFDFRTDDLV